MYEIEAVVEIWRTQELTMNIVYPTHYIAAVKGLRGTFSLSHKRELERKLKERGIKTVLYERKNKDGTFSIKTVEI